MSYDPRDAEDERPVCPSCRGLGYLPGNHDRGAIPCGCDETEDEA